MRLDATPWIGLPFRSHGRDREGLDCWGLVRLVYRERLGIELPGYDEAYGDARTDRASIATEILARRDEAWTLVKPGTERPADVLLFELAGQPCHVGLVVDPDERTMLHCEASGIGSCIERWDSPLWEQRLIGVWRYAGNPRARLHVATSAGPIVPPEERLAPEGLTLAEIVAAEVPEARRGWVRIYLGDDPLPVPCELWPRVRPKAGTRVLLLLVPAGGGGGGGKVLRSALMIGILAASLTIPGAIGLSGTLGSVVGAGIGVAGSLAVNAIAPIPKPKMAERDPPGGAQFSIEGATNTINPFGVIPMVLGRARMVPPLGARPYAERVGSDQYLRLVVLWGYGPVSVSDIRIGRTPIDELPGVTQQHRWNPGGGDPELSLFPRVVNEDRLSLELIGGEGWQTRSTAAETVEILAELTCPSGLQRISSNGKKKGSHTVEIEHRHRPAGGVWSATSTVTLSADTTEPLFHTIRITGLPAGAYEIAIRRVTPNVSEQDRSRIQDRVYWSLLQSFETGDPIDAPGVARSAFRIRASDLVNGQIEISGVVQTLGRSWNGSTWLPGQPIRNPAALFRHVAQHPQALALPRNDAQLDLVGLQSWHQRCAAKGWTFDAVIDFEASLSDILSRIATVGRASLSRGFGQLGVVQDRPGLTPAQLFTPRNSRNLELTREFVRRPHALRVRFQNEDKNWEQDELLVYDDGFSASNATRFEAIELFGITSERDAFSFGRRTLALGVLRPETVTFEVDWEYLAAPLGSLVQVQHDAILVGVASGRVKSRVLQNGNAECVSITLDERVTLDGTPHAIRVRLPTGAQVVHPIAPHVGETDTLTFSPAITSGFPTVGALVAVGRTGVETLPLVVTKIECRGGWDTATITAVPFAPELENADEEIAVYDPRITLPRVVRAGATPGLPRPQVASVRSDEPVLEIGPDGAYVPAIVVVLAPHEHATAGLVRTELSWRIAGSSGDWRTVAIPGDGRVGRITGVAVGRTYQLSLRHIFKDLYGAAKDRERPGPSTGLNHTVIGATTAPDRVRGLHQDGELIRWSDRDLAPDHAGWRLRSAAEEDTPWSFADAAHEGLLSEASFPLDRISPDHDHVLVVAVDRSGLQSEPPAVLTLTRQRGVERLVATEIDLAGLGFPGMLAGGRRVEGFEGRPFVEADLLGAFFGVARAAFWDATGSDAFFDFRWSAIEYITTVAVPADIRSGDALRVMAVGSVPAEVAVRWQSGLALELADLDDELPVLDEDLDAPLFVPDEYLNLPALTLAAETNEFVSPRRDIRAIPSEPIEIRVRTPGGRGLEPHTLDVVSLLVTAFERVETLHDVDLPVSGARVPPPEGARRIVYAEADLHSTSAAFARREQRDATGDARAGPFFRAYRLAGDVATPTAARCDVRIGYV